jgi:hypothetical protein
MMKSDLYRVIGLTLVLTALLMPSMIWARDNGEPYPIKGPRTMRPMPAEAVYDLRVHYVGEIWMSMTNRGLFNTQHGGGGQCNIDQQVLRVNRCPSFEFPGGSQIDYLFAGGFWFGGIAGTDTSVTCGYSQSGSVFELESYDFMHTELPPGFSSGCGASGQEERLEQVYFCTYADTSTSGLQSGGHRPLGIEVTQVTHQSSDNVARNFILCDLHITNISDRPIHNFYVGVFLDCDAYYAYTSGTPWQDDISGFLQTYPNPTDPEIDDTLYIAWTADNDGDPEGGSWPRSSARGAMGWRWLRYPAGADVSFNWWTSGGGGLVDWGPRMATDLRPLGTGGEGVPNGDLNKYAFMSNREKDYGQLLARIDHTTEGWKPHLGVATCNLADGGDTRSVLSVGPEEVLEPGETVPFTLAFLGGKNLHRFPDNYDQWDCEDPYPFIADLDFSDLANAGWWAGFVFDNYGVDTDNDGYSGDYYETDGLLLGDTIYYTGDGCPDFSGPEPPAGPGDADLELISRPRQLEVIWTGANSELNVDPLLRMNDFEGYRVYMAERNSSDDIPTTDDYSLIASWDIVDYRRITYEPRAGVWEITSAPLTTEEWREIFKDNTCSDDIETFDPRKYATPSLEDAYCYNDVDRFGQQVLRHAYFEPQDFNQGDTIVIGNDTIPNVIQRIADIDTTVGEERLQYGKYRVLLDNLLPAKHYFISVTAFDFGDPLNDLDPLETSPGVCRVDGIPIYSADVVEDFWNTDSKHRDSVRVSVYPNPYKSSFLDSRGRTTSYREQGYEGRYGQDVETIGDQDRRIHFINMPDTATIRIYSLDGDLIRELQHPDRILSTYSSKISWDLVSRNTQAVESGIYIYRVDSKLGSQIGKIVIIK